MNETHNVIRAWENFYVITGSSSAALTGLVFVVSTIAAGRRRQPATTSATSVFSTPTIMHFCLAFLISGIFAAPWPSLGLASTSIGLTGLFGIGYIADVIRRTPMLEGYDPDVGDWTWFIVLPMAAYIALCVSGFMLVHVPVPSSFAIGGLTLVLIFLGIHNAWDVVSYLSINPPEE